ncbi:MAG: glycosyl transferase [delta proteobacterium ML8_F1]|nr:MAG: glycosyl transferase [delta proteobacterium ML8_F1]
MGTIAILTNSINGLYSFRRELVEELLIKNSKIIISAPFDTKTNYFKDIGCNMVEKNISRRGTNPISDFKLLINYIRIINKTKPDVVLTYTIKPNVYGGIACRLTSTSQIANITGLGTAVENKGILQKITLALYKIGLRKSKCIFFQNKENMKFMQFNDIGIENGKLIPGSGVNLSHYELMDYPESNHINFLFISRIMKQKGIDQYLDAAKHIKKRHPNTSFHVLGNCEDSYRDILEEMSEKNIIKYHGRKDDVREYHKISHCTIHPTYYPEGMSNVLLESAACGRPIITTNRSGCKEIVDDGINGYFVEQQNTQDLIEKVEKFINLSVDERKQMGLAGRLKVERGFDRRIVIDAYLEEINR